MSFFPQETKKIRARIRSYERKLQKEKEEHGFYSDGYGKRYLLGPLYILMDDAEGALRYFDWYEQEFPDDSGNTMLYLSWALALFRAGNLRVAKLKFGQAMISNLFVVAKLLDLEEEIDLGEMKNMILMIDLEYMPEEIYEMWDDSALAWGREVYDSQEIQKVRQRYIELQLALETEEPGPERNQLVREMSELERMELS